MLKRIDLDSGSEQVSPLVLKYRNIKPVQPIKPVSGTLNAKSVKQRREDTTAALRSEMGRDVG